jgi:protein-tyrosine phosphatase
VKTVLFLCSGNFYRSRFAEELFNALAERTGLDWRADSAGLAVGDSTANLGPIAGDTVHELGRRHIAVGLPWRYPRQVRASDLAGAARVIALNEGEHRLMLEQQFPGWAERAEYWHIPDLSEAPAGESLGLVDRNVETLIQELRHPA